MKECDKDLGFKPNIECAKQAEPQKGSLFVLVSADDKVDSDELNFKFQQVVGIDTFVFIDVFYFLTLKKQYLIDNPHIFERFTREIIKHEELDELREKL